MLSSTTRMSNSNTPQQQRRSPRLEESCAEECKRCIYEKLDAIGELLVEMSHARSKMKKLAAELVEIQKFEELSSHRCLGREIHRLTRIGLQFDDWKSNASCDLTFIKECVSLRCNEESITRVDFSPTDDYEFLIGDILTRNTHVVDLTVLLSEFPPSYMPNGATHRSFLALVHYVRTSSALRRICVTGYRTGGDARDTNAIALLNAVGSNPNIEDVDWRAYVPPTALHRILVVRPTLKITMLSMECVEWDVYPLQERHLLPQSIANCGSLVKLRLRSLSNDLVMMESILTHLADVATPLQVLSVITNGSVDQLQSLSQYLKVTTTLQHLELQLFSFSTGTVESILEGLQYHYALPTACINKLSVIYCDFDEPAMDKFSHFLKDTRYNEASPCSVLQELEFTHGFGRPTPHLGGVIASSLASQPPIDSSQYQLCSSSTKVGNRTVGSGIKKLKLQPFHCMQEFCETAQTHAKYIHLSCLHLSDLGHEECLLLASCLPQLVSLQELYLENVDSGISSQLLLLSMIRQCGNIRAVSIRDEKGCTLLNDSQSHMANAFCDRNQALSLQFSKTIKWDWKYEIESSFLENRQPKRPKRTRMLSIDDCDTALLLPMLFHVAKQVPLTRVSTVMKALLNLVVEGIESK